MLPVTQLAENLARDLRTLFTSLELRPLANIESILGPLDEFDTPVPHSELVYFLDEIRSGLSDCRVGTPRALWEGLKRLDKARARVAPIPLFPDPPASLRQAGKAEFSAEAWFFINGIGTDREILRRNGVALAELFHRPIELIHNPTLGLLPDLLESITGATFDHASVVAGYALERVSLALTGPAKRVVLLGHSQGGLIVSNVVEALIGRFGGDAERMEKLEVYTFGSASYKRPLDESLSTSERRVPYVEDYANTNDLVARIGVLSRDSKRGDRVFVNERSGHLLNAHYLSGMRSAQSAYGLIGVTRKNESNRKNNRKNKSKKHFDSRLMAYRWGKGPS